MKMRVSVLAVALVVPVLVMAQAADVTGKWDVTVSTEQGDRPAVLTISQTGEKLAGTIGGPQGDMPADVSLKGNAITVSFTMQTQNGPLDITMSGKVDGNAMQGNVDIGGMGAATWNARRTPSQDPKPKEGQEKPAATMTGTWAIEANHSAGTSTPTVSITQTGEKLSGKYVGSYGEAPLTGTIKGGEFTFRVEIGTEQKVEVVYTGTLDGDTIKGSLTMGEMGEGTFTGKRK
jgi:hypothetical protein